MERYLLRRLTQAVFTVLGVMLITFILFRVIAGDVSSSYVNQKLGAEARHAFNEKHKLDRPGIFNFHRRLEINDHTAGSGLFSARDSGSSTAAKGLDLHLAPLQTGKSTVPGSKAVTITSKLIFNLKPQSQLSLIASIKAGQHGKLPNPTLSGLQKIIIGLSDGTMLSIDLAGVRSVADLTAAIENHPANGGKCTATITPWSLKKLFDSQFFWHLYENVTFSGRSYATEQTLFDVIGERGKFSLSITVPAMALGWLFALVLSCLVAYYRGGLIDRLTVFVTVLGMCVPTLAYMLIGQWAMFIVAPKYAAGLASPWSIYVPVLIMVISGLGWSVRFYRTIILNEITKDYVRTARAKGVPLAGILFKHVLKNCMLPILTEVVTEIPFLITGALLLEKFFGIPGLGDLLLTSITSRDVPIITGLTFFTTILFVISLLVTDILYAVFDPRIRLR
jgi:peptide/nickel transport system permease protein